MGKEILFYHTDNDGFGAAWAFHAYYPRAIEYEEFEYGSQLPDVGRYDHIIFCDVTPNLTDLDNLVMNGTRVTILDHHASFAEHILNRYDNFDNFQLVYDPNRSGCVLAYEYCARANGRLPGTSVPLILQYVQDRDLWTWELESSREVNAGLGTYPKTFADWYKASEDLIQVANVGKAILSHKTQICSMIAEQVQNMGRGIALLNCTAYWSEVADVVLRSGYGTVFLYSIRRDGKRKWSVRGNNARAYAEEFGGGGHDRAAGFVDDGELESSEVVDMCTSSLDL